MTQNRNSKNVCDDNEISDDAVEKPRLGRPPKIKTSNINPSQKRKQVVEEESEQDIEEESPKKKKPKSKQLEAQPSETSQKQLKKPKKDLEKVGCITIRYDCSDEKHPNHSLHGFVDKALVSEIEGVDVSIERDEVFLLFFYFS